VRQEVGSKKLIALGLQITPMEKIIRDAVESLKSRGHISWILMDGRMGSACDAW
jgi:hypothetical protein